MGEATVIILHPGADGEGPVTRLLAEARDRLVAHQARLFEHAGVHVVRIEHGAREASFGERLVALAGGVPGGLIILGAGAVPRLSPADVRRLVAVAGGGGGRALTNNRYSSDVCAVSDAGALRDLSPLRGDNALPRWLAERAGFAVEELTGRERLALDLDAPLDLALVALLRRPPAGLGRLARERGLAVPRLEELRALATDPRRELLVFGRASSRTLAWLERHVACRVRFLAEERGLRTAAPGQRPPRATLGRLLADRGPAALADVVAELADGAVLDSRVLLADRLGADEHRWPAAEDRFASDLLRADGVADPWLRELTASAAAAAVPVLLGGHSLVGPGLPLLLRQDRGTVHSRGA